MSALAHRLEYDALRGFFALCRSVPERNAFSIGRALGDFLYDWVRIRRDVALANLRASFPEKSEDEIRGIARACYRTFAQTVVDFARLPRLSREELLRGAEITGREHLDAVVGSGKGAILLSGHFGNWEWMGSLFPAMGYPTRVVVGEQRNRPVGALMNRIRSEMGVGVLSAEKDLRGIMQALRRREFVAMVADQDAGRDGIFVDFLGRPASTAVGPVRLARRFDVPILMGFGIRLPDGRHRLELESPIVIPRDMPEEEALRAYTSLWSRKLEDRVRRFPDHWFWMHRRWKTRPDAVDPRGREGS